MTWVHMLLGGRRETCRWREHTTGAEKQINTARLPREGVEEAPREIKWLMEWDLWQEGYEKLYGIEGT